MARLIAGVVVWCFVVLHTNAAMDQAIGCTLKRSVYLHPRGHSFFNNAGLRGGHDDKMQYEDVDEASLPIGYAASQGNLEGVRTALRAGEGDLDWGDVQEGMVQASARGHIVILQALLDWRAEHGALEPITDGGSSPLVNAAARGYGDSVRLLIANGANVSEVDTQFENFHFSGRLSLGSTALIEAAAHGHGEIVGELLSGGARAEQDMHGRTALSAAAENGHSHVVDIILAQLNKSESIQQMLDLALRTAVARNDLEIVSKMLDAGAKADSLPGGGDDCESVEKHGHRELINLAASSGTADILRVLIKHGANANSQTHALYGKTPLIIACENGNADAVRVLIERGANVSHTMDRKGPYTALLAAFEGPIVRMLIEAGADPNQVPKS